MKYAVVDIETTGGRANRDRITEVAVVLYDGEEIVDRFESLVNPECPIPYGITELTGISQEMVQDAPRFFEIGRQLVEFTEGAVFVAHNVRFDYSFLREEFKRLGFTFSRKTLCTVQLSRKVFPGLPSYSLGNLIDFFDIPVKQRHRAMADALATTRLLELALENTHGEKQIRDLVHMGIRESMLPEAIPLERIHSLPEECGVYYFHDEKGDVVYVGKSSNIQKRIASHFADKTPKASLLQRHAKDISTEVTGSELVALLLESYEIKRLQPPINRAQRQQSFPYGVVRQTDAAGYHWLDVVKIQTKQRRELHILSEYPTALAAKSHLQAMVERFGLCPKLCGLEKSSGACFWHRLKKCQGACVGLEPPESYNDRLALAEEALGTIFEKDFLVVEKGRNDQEQAVVLVQEGRFQGFGYVDSSQGSLGLEDLVQAVRPFPDNPETRRIIRRYLAKAKGFRVIPL